jgi:hypothetical protein
VPPGTTGASTVACPAWARAAAAATATAGRRHRRAGLGLAERLFGLGDHASLELLGALGRTAGPVAQALELSRLGEVEQ